MGLLGIGSKKTEVRPLNKQQKRVLENLHKDLAKELIILLAAIDAGLVLQQIHIKGNISIQTLDKIQELIKGIVEATGGNIQGHPTERLKKEFQDFRKAILAATDEWNKHREQMNGRPHYGIGDYKDELKSPMENLRNALTEFEKAYRLKPIK